MRYSSTMRYSDTIFTPEMILVIIGLVATLAIVALFLWISLYRVHWRIRAAERELMDLVHRIENAEASRKKKIEEKTALFSRLVSQTAQLYSSAMESSSNQLLVGELGQSPFNQEIVRLLDAQDREIEKQSKRKGKVRINAALLRELLYGTGYQARSANMTPEEWKDVMGTIAQLGQVSTSFIWLTAAVFGHPGKNIEWVPEKLTGKQALDRLCHV